jgi:hypothetical protein
LQNREIGGAVPRPLSYPRNQPQQFRTAELRHAFARK